ncbi:hypothetical protein [Paraburkholderia sp. JPY419]|uniref:hypothetical protein n=1 Tax=Paraburkholderia sp. JPY419 TaxID=667660 RepID=UPI003D190B9B
MSSRQLHVHRTWLASSTAKIIPFRQSAMTTSTSPFIRRMKSAVLAGAARLFNAEQLLANEVNVLVVVPATNDTFHDRQSELFAESPKPAFWNH